MKMSENDDDIRLVVTQEVRVSGTTGLRIFSKKNQQAYTQFSNRAFLNVFNSRNIGSKIQINKQTIDK